MIQTQTKNKPIRFAVGRTHAKVGYMYIEYRDGSREMKHLDYRKPKERSVR